MVVASTAASHDHPSAAALADMHSAITASDNAAAEALWEGLGSPTSAAAQVEAVLRAGGDPTVVQSQRVRAGFTAFGQTEWSLANQAVSAAALPCIAHSAGVLALMGQVTADQRWGLGASGAPAQFKGGWGPDPGGRYLVRQMGVLTLPDTGRVGIALAAEPSDGTFAGGVRDVSALAAWAVTNLRGVGSTGC